MNRLREHSVNTFWESAPWTSLLCGEGSRLPPPLVAWLFCSTFPYEATLTFWLLPSSRCHHSPSDTDPDGKWSVCCWQRFQWVIPSFSPSTWITQTCSRFVNSEGQTRDRGLRIWEIRFGLNKRQPPLSARRVEGKVHREDEVVQAPQPSGHGCPLSTAALGRRKEPRLGEMPWLTRFIQGGTSHHLCLTLLTVVLLPHPFFSQGKVWKRVQSQTMLCDEC